jgi:hypothetical protein
VNNIELVMTKGGRKRMTLAVTVVLNMLTIPQNRPFWVFFYTKKDVNMQILYKCVQKTFLRIILGDSYVSYTAALEMCGLQTLHDRREKRCLDFAVKCTKHPVNMRLSPST